MKIKRQDLINPDQYVAHYRLEDNTIQDVWTHLENVGQRSWTNALKVSLHNPAQLCGLLHDLGKASQEFNDYIRSAEGLPLMSNHHKRTSKGKVDHSTAGSQWLYNNLKNSRQSVLSRQLLPLITASHHSELMDCLTPEGENNFVRRMEKDDQLTHYSETVSNMPNAFKNKVESILSNPDLEESLKTFLHKLNETEDGTSERCFKLGLLARLLFSTLLDADRVDTIDFTNPQAEAMRPDGAYLSWPALVQRLEDRLSQFSVTNDIDKHRQAISQRCLEMAIQKPGVFRLTVPTGGGKTLASLRFALNHVQEHQMDRIIYVVPYTSIIDQNARTVREILETGVDEPAIVMEHHSNLDPERAVEEHDHLWTQNWDAPVVLTTMVQFLEALFGSGTGPVRRLHQMANSVIIFDEIQSLPIRCVHMFNVAIRFLVKGCNSSAVLCTATQPLLEQVTPASRALPSTAISEITPDVNQVFQQFKRVNANMEADLLLISHERLAEEILKVTDQLLSVLAIVNTKKDATMIYESLKSKCQTPVYHLSTRMCPSHRRTILKKVTDLLKENKPVVCISTQLIEAGVDIDFNVVFRAMAGLDSIQQAAGRCNRHGKLPHGQLYLFQLENENISKLPDINAGKEVTLRILDEFRKNPDAFDGDLLSAKAMNQYYKYYFYQRQSEMNYPLPRSEGTGSDGSIFDLLADNSQAVFAYQRKNKKQPDLLLRQSFQTAAKAFHVIDSKTQGIIVPYEEGKELIHSLCALSPWDHPGKLMQMAQQYAVNCYAHELRQLQQAGALFETTKGSGIFYLDQRHYSLETGIELKGTLETMDTLTV